jgi:hypothetical protein
MRHAGEAALLKSQQAPTKYQHRVSGTKRFDTEPAHA